MRFLQSNISLKVGLFFVAAVHGMCPETPALENKEEREKCELEELKREIAELRGKLDRTDAEYFKKHPLHAAAAAGDAIKVAALIRVSAGLNVQDFLGDTPLMRALKHPDCMELLLAAKADPEIKRKDRGPTVLQSAAMENQTEAVKLLMAHGAKLDPLSAMYLEKKTEFVAMLKAEPAIATREFLGASLLHWAVAVGMADSCGVLLQHGADINKVHNLDHLGHATPLAVACEHHPELMAFLLKSGADPNVPYTRWEKGWYAVELVMPRMKSRIANLIGMIQSCERRGAVAEKATLKAKVQVLEECIKLLGAQGARGNVSEEMSKMLPPPLKLSFFSPPW